MTRNAVRFRKLPDNGDNRGFSYKASKEALAFSQKIVDLHITSIVPGAIRGNHFHNGKDEVIYVIYQSKWQLVYDEGEKSEVKNHEITGVGCIEITVSANCAHAIKNTGSSDLLILAASNGEYDPELPCTRRRVVVE